MNIKNKSGPSPPPWGTPDKGVKELEKVLLHLTFTFNGDYS